MTVKKDKIKFGVCSLIVTFIKIMLFIVLAICLLIYWDIKSNNSVYSKIYSWILIIKSKFLFLSNEANEVKIQLDKIGLLEATLHVVEYSQHSLERVEKFDFLIIVLFFNNNTVIMFFKDL